MQNTENVIKFPTRRRHKGGFTPVPHDLLDAVASGRFKGSQIRVLLAVVRLTLGWQKDRAQLRLADIAEVTGMKSPNVSKVLKELEEMGALEVVYTRSGRIIGIIEDYSTLVGDEAPANGYESDNSKAITGYQSDNPEVINPITPSYKSKDRIKDRGEGACAPTAPEPKAEKPKKRKTSAPDDFPITDDMRAWAKKAAPSVADLESVTAQFLDHHAAKGSTFLDWRRAWQTWIRNEEKFSRGRASNTPAPSGKSLAERRILG